MKEQALIDEMLRMADLFIDLESTLEQYYLECEKKFPDRAKIFKTLSNAEHEHKKIFEDIRYLIQMNPDDWELGKFNEGHLITMIDLLKTNLAYLKEDKLYEYYALTYIAGVELSIVETQFTEAFKIKDEKTRKIIKQIGIETTGHKNLILKFLPEVD